MSSFAVDLTPATTPASALDSATSIFHANIPTASTSSALPPPTDIPSAASTSGSAPAPPSGPAGNIPTFRVHVPDVPGPDPTPSPPPPSSPPPFPHPMEYPEDPNPVSY
jgi:hypothetical protein